MEFKPFPGISRFPEEPKLEGAPHSPEDSLFVSSPELVWLLDFPHKNSEEVHKEIRQFTKRLATEPEKLEGLFAAFDMLDPLPGYAKILRYKEKIIDGLKKINFKELPPLSPAAIEKWLSYYAEDTVFKNIAKNFLKEFICSNKDSRAITNFLYDLLLTGIKSGNQKIEKLASQIICNDVSGILKADSKEFLIMALSVWTPNDDETLKKAIDLDTARDYYIYLKYPELKQRYFDGLKQSREKEEYVVEFQKIQAQWDKTKMRKLSQLMRTGAKDTTDMTVEDMTVDDYPNNVIFQNPTELRKLIGKLYTQESNRDNTEEQYINIILPNFQGASDNNSDIIDIIKRALNKEKKDAKIEIDEDYWESLAYLHPGNIDVKKLERLGQENKLLVQEIQDDTRYLLSPRGDLLEISDDDLKNLGFKTILYEMDPKNKRDTNVTIQIGNFKFKLLLDEFFTFKRVETKDGLLLPPDGEFLKHVILSHLREIRCSEKLNEAEENKGAESGSRSAFYSRRAHRRKLPIGQSPSAEQIQRTWDHYHINITRINQEAQMKGDQQQVTFVFEVKNIATSGIGPVLSQAPDATKRLKEIIA